MENLCHQRSRCSRALQATMCDRFHEIFQQALPRVQSFCPERLDVTFQLTTLRPKSFRHCRMLSQSGKKRIYSKFKIFESKSEKKEKSYAILIFVAEIKVSNTFYHIYVKKKFGFFLAHSRELVEQAEEFGQVSQVSLSTVFQQQNQRLYELCNARHFTDCLRFVVFWFLLKIECEMQRSKSLNDVNHEPLEHLSNHLIWTLNQHLNWPPRLLRHVLQKPFTSLLACVELFREKFNPKDHCGLEENVRN